MVLSSGKSSVPLVMYVVTDCVFLDVDVLVVSGCLLKHALVCGVKKFCSAEIVPSVHTRTCV